MFSVTSRNQLSPEEAIDNPLFKKDGQTGLLTLIPITDSDSISRRLELGQTGQVRMVVDPVATPQAK